MKNAFTKQQRWILRIAMLLMVPGILLSCLHLRAVYFPEVVKTNETFEVTMVADMRNPLDEGVTERFGYGFVGVLLPVGWTISAESMSWRYVGLDKDYDYGTQTMTGKCLLDTEMTEYCVALDQELWGEEYYWQGFKTDGRIHSENIDSIVIKFNVKTNDQIGDHMMLVGIQETSFDKDGFEAGISVPGNSLMDNKPDGPFYKTGTSDEYSKSYLSINVEKGSGSSIEYSKQDKENYTIAALGNGQIRVDLRNELKIDATAIVYDKNGRQVASQQLTQMENVLDATLSPDVYFVAVQKDGIRSAKKVLVK